MVVHSQLSLSVAPTFPSDKYPVIGCRSAYCATSSGIDIDICRASTQPALSSLVLTRYQSSVGAFGAATGAASANSPDKSVERGREISTQLAGGAGAGGRGGGGSLPCFEDLGGAL